MRGIRFALTATLAVVALAAVGCGGGNDSTTTETTTTETTSTDTTATDTTTTTEAATGTKLIGTVGSVDDADAFDISLTTEDGTAVTTLTPGDYTLEINDLSTIHNFHLTGPGVDVMSEVDTTEDENYDITLEDGTYNYVCDPHASQMNGSFTVSG
jgi:plastocyanin